MMREYLRWRWDMVRHWRHVLDHVRGAKRMVEVGTWRGDSARRWIDQADVQYLVCVDPYRAKNDASWESTQDACDLARRQAMIQLAPHMVAGRLAWIHEASPTAARHFDDESLDAVYVDGDHSLQAVRSDLAAWWPKLRAGGVLIGDDYLDGRWWGGDVIEAVAGFQPVDEDRRWIHGRWFAIRKAP